MPLPALNWRRLAPVTLAANTINAMLDAIYTAGTATTYANGSTRTPGTDCAWTFNRDTTNALQTGATTAVWGTPPTSFPGVTNPGTVLPQTVIWAGSTATPTATPQYVNNTTDSRTANVMYISVCLNPGAYSNWNSATPFTTGSFLGFATAAVAPASAVWNTLYMYESQEAVIVVLGRTSPNTQTSVSIGGAWLDAGVSAPNILVESDGRLYGIASSGSGNYLSSTWLSNTTSDVLFYETQTANNSRCGMLLPGSGSTLGMRRFGTFSPSTSTQSRDNSQVFLPMHLTSIGGNFYHPCNLRQMGVTSQRIVPNVLQVGGVDAAYYVAATFSTAQSNAIGLLV